MGLLVVLFIFLSACSKSGPAGPNLDAVVPSIAGGAAHTCALSSRAELSCWGLNDHGQLGNNESEISSYSMKPTSVAGFKSIDRTSDEDQVADQVVAGRAHTCVRTRSGQVKCWGWNSVGQLGNQSTANSLEAVNVANLESSVVQLASGEGHVCALLSTGLAQCWGYNSFGQLGNSSTTHATTATEVSGLTGVISIAAGRQHTCAVLDTGAVKCWGFNGFGQLGNGNRIDQTAPVDVSGLSSGVQSVYAGGDHSCALLTDGSTLKCWGRNDQGQLGKGQMTAAELVPATVTGISSSISAVSAGYSHTCAITSGALMCWGANTSGQLGNSLFADTSTPTTVTGFDSGTVSVGAGVNHSCAFTSENRIRCWGKNNVGQLGDGTSQNRTSPQNVFKM